MKKSKNLYSIIVCVGVFLLLTIFGEFRYHAGLSEGYELGKAEKSAGIGETIENVPLGDPFHDALNALTTPAPNKEQAANMRYTGPEAWMLNPTGKAPFWTERTDAEALALELSDNAAIEMKNPYSRKSELDPSVPLAADEAFQLNLVIDDEIAEDTLHEMNCYYPKHVAAGETAEIRIVLEEENGKIYVGAIQLTAGDEGLNLVHGSADPDAWYGANRVECEEDEGVFSVFFYTGATEAHWERPMFAGTSGYGGITHCNYHCLDDDAI